MVFILNDLEPWTVISVRLRRVWRKAGGLYSCHQRVAIDIRRACRDVFSECPSSPALRSNARAEFYSGYPFECSDYAVRVCGMHRRNNTREDIERTLGCKSCPAHLVQSRQNTSTIALPARQVAARRQVLKADRKFLTRFFLTAIEAFLAYPACEKESGSDNPCERLASLAPSDHDWWSAPPSWLLKHIFGAKCG
jgi:hypothetical protein